MNPPVFHGCGCPRPGAPPVTLQGLDRAARPVSRVGAIDVHAHVLTPEVDRIVADHSQWQTILRAQPEMQGAATVRHNLALFASLRPRMTDPELRLADMAAMGIARQVISPSPTQYYYWTDRALSATLVRLQNQTIIGLCERFPNAFSGLGAVSLQFPDLAAIQLAEIMRHPGIKGVEISSIAGDLALADPQMAPFWAAAEALGAVVLLHPLGTTLGTRLSRHYLTNVIGQPLETTIAVSDLLFSGLMDRHPGLKLVCAHGGGYLPTYIARSDHAWHVRPEAHGCRLPPSAYLRHLWFDSLVYDPAALRSLADRVGSDRIVLGTDYPYDMGAYDPHGLIASAGFGEMERDAILAGNAAALLDLPI